MAGVRIGVIGIAAALTLALTAPAAQGRQFKPESLDYAALVRHKHAPKRHRFTLRLFTHYAHQRNGDTVGAAAKKSHGVVYANEKGPNNGFAEWRINALSSDGKRLISELRRDLRHKGKAKFTGLLTPSGAIGPEPSKVVLRGFNKLARAQSEPIAFRSR